MARNKTYTIENFLGKKIESWTVLEYSHSDKKGHQYWICQCDCGIIKPVRGNALGNGLTKSCPACRGQAARNINSPYWKGGKFISGNIYNVCKKTAYKRGIEFNISIEYLENKWLEQNGLCAYTGEILTIHSNGRNKKSYNASIDRIDSSKGYIEENVQWVLKEVNIMKRELPEKVFLEICFKISNYKNDCLH